MMNRRTFLCGLTLGALVAPLAAEGQQAAMPVIGYLSQRSPTDSASIVTAFHQGLKEEGFVEGQNVAIESRFAKGKLTAFRRWRVISFAVR